MDKAEPSKRDIFDRMRVGEPIRLDDPQYHKVQEIVTRTLKLSVALNTSTDVEQIRDRLSEIIGRQIDQSTIIFAPFYTNFGRFIQIGKNVFINHACSFLDMGGITIEDEVLIGPKVNLITENHPLNPADNCACCYDCIFANGDTRQNGCIGANPGVSFDQDWF